MAVSTDSQRDALVERLFAAKLGLMDLATIHIGERLGLYDALASEPAPDLGGARRAHRQPTSARCASGSSTRRSAGSSTSTTRRAVATRAPLHASARATPRCSSTPRA